MIKQAFISLEKMVLFAIVFCSFFQELRSQSCSTDKKNSWEWPSHSNWYFGDGNRLKFTPTSATPSALGNFASYEGTLGVSDDSGNLLRFSNGVTIWNAAGVQKYTPIPVGQGGTGGKNSASQGVLAVRHPLNPTKYFVFSTDDAIEGGGKGFNYTVFDAAGNLVSAPIKIGNYTTCEGVNATFHANGVDIWISVCQAQNSSIINTYLLKCDGTVTGPVVSTVGPKITGDPMRGALEFSPDGTRAATVNHNPSSNTFPNGGASEAVMIYDFNNSTGVFSNPLKVSALPGAYWWQPGAVTDGYDCEFSPDGKGLYVAYLSGEVAFFDLSSNNAITIFNSRKLIGNGGKEGAIEMAADGNMYHQGNALKRLSGNLNTGVVTYTNVTGLTKTIRDGLPNLFLPPQEEPDIQEVGPFCSSDGPVDLNTLWLCRGINAESQTAPASVYSGTGITDAAQGIFSPSVAGEGTHRIIFTKCSVDDTIYITVNDCNCPDTALKNIAPICAGSTIDLSLQKVTTQNGTWSIQGTAGANWPTIVGNVFTTDANTVAGNYTVRFTLSPVPSNATCPKYAERVIKVNAKPILTFNTTPVCEGSAAINFTATPAGGTFSPNATFTPSTAGSTSITYTYTDANSCSNSITTNQVVNAKPILTFNTTPVCEGSADINFTETPAGGIFSPSATFTPSAAGSAAITYTYIDANSCSNSITTNQVVNAKPILTFNTTPVCEGSAAINFTAIPAGGTFSPSATFTPSAAGSTPITYTYTDANSCSNSITTNQVVNAKPTVTFSTTELCEGDASIVFNASPTGGVYSGSGISGNTFTPITAGATVVTYTYTDANGCVNAASANQVVNAKPSLNPLDQSICPGSSTNLDAGAGFSTYTWMPGGETTQQISVSSGNTYSATVTNAKGCSASDNIVVTVNANLSIDLGADKKICEGESADFTVNYGGAGVQYNWSSGQTSKNITVNTSGTYHVDVVDPMGCSGSDDVQLIVNPLPTPSIADAEICAGSTHIFDAGNYVSYLWSTDETTQTISKGSAGSYAVTVTDTNGCKAIASATLNVTANPTVNLGADYTGCGGTSALFDAGNAGSTYLWNNGATSKTISVTTDGTYSVEVTDAKGCKGNGSVKATFIAIPSLEIGNDIDLCEGESAAVNAVVSPASSNVTWSTGESGLSITANSGRIIATANNGGLCSAKDTMNIFVHQAPLTMSIPDQTLCFLDVANSVVDAMAPASQYLWNTGETTKEITVQKGGVYTVDLINEYGCVSSEKINVIEKCESSLFVPNAFTPNDDGRNEIFYVEGVNVYDFELWIFDRWGEVIYHSLDMKEGWNGKRNNNMQDAQIDVYVWKVKYRFWEDRENNNPLREEVGTVTLVE